MLYSNIRKNKTYTNQDLFIFPKGNPVGKNTVFFLLSPNYKESLDFIENITLDMKEAHCSRYYIESIYKKLINKKNININYANELKNTFANHNICKYFSFNTSKNIISTLKTKSNLIVDLSIWNELFFSDKLNIQKDSMKIELYLKLLNEKINNEIFNGYQKVLIIPANLWNNSLSKNHSKSPLDILLNVSYKYNNLSHYISNIDLYLLNTQNKSFIVLDNSYLSDNKLFVKLSSEIKKMKIESNIDNDGTDSDESVTDEDDIDDSIMDIDDDEIEESEDDEDNITITKKKKIITSFRPEFSTDEKIRIQTLQKKQDSILSQSIETLKDKVIEQESFEGIINTTNKTILHPKSKNFTKSYNEKLMEKDIDNAISALSNAEYPIFIIGKSVEDTSNTLNAKKTYTYQMQDYQGNKFSVKFDMPIIIDDKYIYLNGIKSVIENQLIPMPIIKSGPNEVQIIGMYNKIYLRRKETDKLDAKSQVIKKYFLDQKNLLRYKVRVGNSMIKNTEFDTPLDFDNLSKNISELYIENNKIVFDIPKLLNEINEFRDKENKKPITNAYTNDNRLIVGYNTVSKELITINEANGENILDTLLNLLPDNEKAEILKTKPGTARFTYIKATMKKVEIPIIYFMLYCEGLTSVLRKIGVKYDIVEPGTSFDIFNRSSIKAKDKWIIWDRYPFHNSLLLNGMVLIPTEEYTLEELDSKLTYVELVSHFFKETRVAFVLDQFKDFMLDPISIEILKDMNMATDLTELFITAAIMLNSNHSDSILDMKNVRLRNNEIFSQFVYKAFADGYLDYRKSIYKKKPDSLKVNKHLVVTNINGSAKTKMSGCKLIEGASSLNPVLELEKQGAVSYRGPSGINRDDAYTLPKRAFNPSMTGIIGISSSPDANVGIQRQLTLDPNIKSTRGYLEAADPENIKNMTSAELFTPAELLSPIGVMHDDGQRTAMAYKQSKYMVLTDQSEPVLIGNKVESAIPYYLSREFVVTAKDDGKVIAIENNIVIIEYKNGERDSFSLEAVQQKNSAGGFYIETKFETHLKEDSNFKKGEVLAYNPNAFTKNDDDLSASMNIGVLCKIAIVPTYDEYEDSAPISASAAEKMATTIVMEQSIIIKKNARVQFIAKKGDHVNVGDKLAVFDDWADEENFADWLNDLSDSLDQDVAENVFTTKESEYAGEIVDIKYYSSVDYDELSDSFKPYIKNYWSNIRKRNKTLEKYQNKTDTKTIKCGQLITEKDGKTESSNNKIFGREIEDGVLVRFFIKHKDIMKKGDKLTNYTALKGIVSNVIEKNLEPFSEYRKDEPIDILMAPGAILARKTPSAILSMFGNKCMLELERQVIDIWNKK